MQWSEYTADGHGVRLHVRGSSTRRRRQSSCCTAWASAARVAGLRAAVAAAPGGGRARPARARPERRAAHRLHAARLRRRPGRARSGIEAGRCPWSATRSARWSPWSWPTCGPSRCPGWCCSIRRFDPAMPQPRRSRRVSPAARAHGRARGVSARTQSRRRRACSRSLAGHVSPGQRRRLRGHARSPRPFDARTRRAAHAGRAGRSSGTAACSATPRPPRLVQRLPNGQAAQDRRRAPRRSTPATPSEVARAILEFGGYVVGGLLRSRE